MIICILARVRLCAFDPFICSSWLIQFQGQHLSQALRYKLEQREKIGPGCRACLQVYLLRKQLRESDSNFIPGARDRGGVKPIHMGGRGMGPLPGPPGGNLGRDPNIDRMGGFKRMR